MRTTRERLHELVNQIPADRLDDVARYIEHVAGAHRPTLKEILANAPIDDEPLTPEEEEAIVEAEEAIAAGRLISHEQVKRQLGLS